ncbi:hypothetical protein EMMF5_001874 [Cystobasidiomycetes sp. EMM_F5]
MATQTVKSQLLRVASQWPRDAIRPNHQFSEAITKIADSQPAWSQASTSAAATSAIRDGQELVRALDRLLSNKIARQYPLGDRTKTPPGSPKHYVNLMDGLKRAERGEKEPWYVLLVGNVELDNLARNPTDKSYILRNTTTEQYGAKHVYKLNAHTDKEAVYVQRPNGYEKQWRRRCPRCELLGDFRDSYIRSLVMLNLR